MSQTPEVVIQRSWGAMIAWFGPLVLMFGAFALINRLTLGSDDWFGTSIWVGAAVVLLIELIVFKRMSVVLRDDVMVVVNVRRIEIPVSRIRAIQVRGGGLFTPYLVEVHDGQRVVALRATAVGWKRKRPWTDEQLHLVGQWWLAHGGTERQSVVHGSDSIE